MGLRPEDHGSSKATGSPWQSQRYGEEMDIKIKGVLIRISKKLDQIDDSIDQSLKIKEDEIKRLLEKMVDSLDRLIYDENYFGKPYPEVQALYELRTLLKEGNGPALETNIKKSQETIYSLLVKDKRAQRS
jgi:hypothetical protein